LPVDAAIAAVEALMSIPSHGEGEFESVAADRQRRERVIVRSWDELAAGTAGR